MPEKALACKGLSLQRLQCSAASLRSAAAVFFEKMLAAHLAWLGVLWFVFLWVSPTTFPPKKRFLFPPRKQFDVL